MYKYLAIVLLSVSANFAAHLPADIVHGQCQLNDPSLNDCILRRARELLPKFCDGVPSAGIPSFDPLHLNALEFSTNEPNLQVKAKLNKVTLIGHRTARIHNFTLNPSTLRGFIITEIPEIRMRSDLEASGTINNFPFDNHAIYNWVFKVVKYAFKYQLTTGMINGVKHYNIQSLELLSSADDGYLQLQSVDPANQWKDDLTATAFNADPKTVMKLMNKFMSKSTASIYKNVINYVLHRVPGKEFLKE